MSVLATIFCLLPIGIAAVYAVTGVDVMRWATRGRLVLFIEIGEDR